MYIHIEREEEKKRQRERERERERESNAAPALDTLRLEVSLRGMRDLQP